ncbi:C4-dicarboxylate TRAP transporter substrate-binding protein [Phaeovulum sp.]|uniref:C4-dicarboxylate TRAP transporter substrate-binding protein n=1 Tax=Phaeovulum sp. TaxID=2934796 RepID=UPI00272F3C4F|nr:C4-dicarboxylate TRAP transporter substrate-binding protein [Phaeovulum sp.]MDP1668164.1 C4-dicarboxylate TRAP transporter substrate-binding protein [Phaeovulum sp.]MDP2064048.1 C4-dicarboxylate TRAP transporter substrate-binding protein [Phaeovulum sp.]MDP3863055.1 C4-dicarboxylate TRAP transporter substrate-binding protein [Phaeovulum sp.]MDZ4119799.1 C4-dicarboxylate TRAP transporter substrate-binding protein [Phaeovulum sp.]
MKYQLTLAAGAFAVALALPVSSQAQTINVTLINGHPPIFLWVKHLTETYIPTVNAALQGSGYTINWTEAYGGTLAAVGGELEALEDGLAEVGVVPTVFEPTSLPLQNVTYYTPFGPSDPNLIMQVMDDLHGSVPGMIGSWEKFGLEYLGGGFALDNYVLMTNFPVATLDDLKSHRIAAPGAAVNWLEGTGAVGVAGNLTTYYNDMQTGVFDGLIVFPTAAAPAKLQEVAPYVTITDFGAQYAGSLVANKDWFAAQPAVVQDALRKGAAAYTTAYLAEQGARVAAAMTTLAGTDPSKTTHLSDAEKARWAAALPDVAGGWAKDADAQGLAGTEVLNAYVAALKAAGVVLPRDWSQR